MKSHFSSFSNIGIDSIGKKNPSKYESQPCSLRSEKTNLKFKFWDEKKFQSIIDIVLERENERRKWMCDS